MKKRKMPKFRSKEEAALFWENHEVLQFVDPDEFKVVSPGSSGHYTFKNPRQKERKQLISIRVDGRLLKRAKTLASRRQTGYQSILKNWLEKGAAR